MTGKKINDPVQFAYQESQCAMEGQLPGAAGRSRGEIKNPEVELAFTSGCTWQRHM